MISMVWNRWLIKLFFRKIIFVSSLSELMYIIIMCKFLIIITNIKYNSYINLSHTKSPIVKKKKIITLNDHFIPKATKSHYVC